MLLWTGNVSKADLELLPAIKNMGYDGVELPISEFDVGLHKEFCKRLNDIGLAATISMALPKNASFISEDKSMRQAAITHMKNLIDAANIIGTDMIMGPFYQPLGVFSGNGATEKEKDFCVQSHKEVAEYAGKCGVNLAMEVLNRFECYMFNTIEQGVMHIKKVNHPNLKLAYDTFHANIEEAKPIDTIKNNFQFISHVHISENNRGIVGSGHNPIAETLSAFKSCGYDSWFTVEMFGSPIKELAAATCCWRKFFDDPLLAAKKSIDYLKNIC